MMDMSMRHMSNFEVPKQIHAEVSVISEEHIRRANENAEANNEAIKQEVRQNENTI